jgi:hypothetical protein
MSATRVSATRQHTPPASAPRVWGSMAAALPGQHLLASTASSTRGLLLLAETWMMVLALEQRHVACLGFTCSMSQPLVAQTA